MGELILHPNLMAAMSQEHESLKARCENLERMLKDREMELIDAKSRTRELLGHLETIERITQESSVKFECQAALGTKHLESNS